MNRRIYTFLTGIVVCMCIAGCQQKPQDRIGEPIALGETAQTRIVNAHNGVPMFGGSTTNTTVFVAVNADLPDCQRCHADNKKVRGQVPGKAHWDIEIQHADGMQCQTCHVLQEPDKGQGLTGPVPLEHNNAVCRTCHMNQVKDWEGGAHGKRLSGWAEPRVIAVCSQCHDPHNPAIQPRMPVAMPKIIPARLRNDMQKGGSHE